MSQKKPAKVQLPFMNSEPVWITQSVAGKNSGDLHKILSAVIRYVEFRFLAPYMKPFPRDLPTKHSPFLIKASETISKFSPYFE